MNVLGYELAQETIDRAVLSFPIDRSFTKRDLAWQFMRLGVPRDNWVADRCADRVLQSLRKAGSHTYSGGRWRRRKIRAA